TRIREPPRATRDVLKRRRVRKRDIIRREHLRWVPRPCGVRSRTIAGQMKNGGAPHPYLDDIDAEHVVSDIRGHLATGIELRPCRSAQKRLRTGHALPAHHLKDIYRAGDHRVPVHAVERKEDETG